MSQFEIHTMGQKGIHEELWIPAERLDECNTHIVGLITIEAAYYGDNFQGEIDPQTNLPVT
ncbi:MAG: hypothetical protein JXA42_18300 [Anaerolineales bacterium]|nr:hypothetical protein [Anaerolineales bacterium]